MESDFRFFPDQASTLAEQVDALYAYLLLVSGFFSVLIAVLVIFFAIRYRRRSEGEVPRQIKGLLWLEVFWMVVPLALVLVMFFWGAWLYIGQAQAPRDAMRIYVLGKQWMWKIEHPSGRSEINRLHVPMGRPVELTMISEDVIHSFYVPAFRIKQDVLPGRYTRMWFQASRTGRFHLFCAEYCGTEHSQMIGEVVVMQPGEYQRWIAAEDAGADADAPMEPLAQTGRRLMETLQCNSCHNGTPRRGPALEGRFGGHVQLASGKVIPFDEGYVRKSILEPREHVSAGYPANMPSYEGRVSEEQILAIVDYLKQDTTTGAMAQQ